MTIKEFKELLSKHDDRKTVIFEGNNADEFIPKDHVDSDGTAIYIELEKIN